MGPDSSLRPALHIGLPRTGTKTLQWHLFAEHPGVYYLGIFDGNRKHPHTAEPQSCRDESVVRMLDGLVLGDLRRVDLAESRRLAGEMIHPPLGQGVVPLFSLETLAVGEETVRRVRAEHLWRLFGPSRILITLRHPHGLLESTYRLVLRRENIQMPDGRAWYRTLDEWFEEEFERVARPHLDYANTVRIYSELFGPESVKVVLFEELRSDPARFVGRVCEHFQLDANALGPWPQRRPTNKRLSAAQVAGIRFVSRSHAAQAILRRLRPGVRALFLRQPRIVQGDRSQRLSEKHRSLIAEMTAAGNRRLERELGVPLAEHGYPV